MNIPITSHFPNMEKSDILLFMKRMNLKETCEYLSISEATGRNWIRQGRLKPLENKSGRHIYFDAAYVKKVKNRLLKDGKLIARRNKTAISSHAVYSDYLSCDANTLRQLQQIIDNDKINSSPLIPTIAYYARQFFLQQNNLEQYETLIKELLAVDSEANHPTSFDPHSRHSFKSVFSESNTHASYSLDFSDDSDYPELSFKPYEDLLGFLYISLTRLDKRKKGGIYYTPSSLAHRLIERAFKYADTPSACFDPSCGTGNFLLMLHSHIKNGTLLCGQDTDPVAIAIARINIALNYPGIGLTALHENIRTADSLKQFPVCKDMLILGNPPWGARLQDTKEDSAALFVQNTVLHQEEQGIISFILPASLLTTKSHHKMRNLLLRETQVVSVDYLEPSFSAVNCPAVILTLKKNSRQPGIIKCDVSTKLGDYTIHDRYIPIDTGSSRFNDKFSDNANTANTISDLWMLHADDPSYELFQKLNHMDNTITLKGAADFALGIVTGDNKRFVIPTDRISNADVTTDANVAIDMITTSDTIATAEPIIRGRNLSRYEIHGPYDRLVYTPNTFQQCAPERYYRAEEKILYRFIGKRPVFAYDNSGCLTLNSCNILIPHIEGLDIKYILAILNSNVAAFFWQTGFASVKLLRSHIEALPIPIADEDEQAEVIALVDKLMTDGQNNGIIQGSTESAGLQKMEINMQLEDRIARLYVLTDSERSIINRGKNY